MVGEINDGLFKIAGKRQMENDPALRSKWGGRSTLKPNATVRLAKEIQNPHLSDIIDDKVDHRSFQHLAKEE